VVALVPYKFSYRHKTGELGDGNQRLEEIVVDLANVQVVAG
jgi:hypothetical protein